MSQAFAAFMTHTLDFISILLLFFNPSPLPFTEERTHETNYCAVVQPLESMREYEGATRSRLVRLSMRGYAEGGVPPVMRMSHPPQGCRASDITAALLEEQSNSPTSFLVG
ncbi:Pleckstrin like domain containing family G member 7 [Dissostichus eleginoides]|uniref:Pleckstrin like domain containing family G member 7 n=1 Tax=Dissostichus eleginoides TaxID=100907 RepID=A0AAD9BMP6_DISEL|nr:Pleckstrin like domain containing family G member 7 [Dissostichus eleginoides]